MPILAAYFHDLSPYIVRLWGNFGLRWYGFAYALAFILGYFILKRLGERGLSRLKPARVMDAMMLLVVGVVLGGRLGYVFFYDPDLLWSFSSSFPWWGVLRLNEGGMASHGGMIGVILACFFIARGFKDPDGFRRDAVPKLHLLDLMAAVAPVGLCLGRLANFINGELLGRIVAQPGSHAPWWSMKFPQELPETFTLTATEGHRPTYTPEQLDRLTAVLDEFVPNAASRHEQARAIVDAVQTGSASLKASIIPKLEPLISARVPSQLLQALAEGPLLAAAIWLIWRRPRAPGVVGCWFLIVYGILRILTEIWRLPDAHLKFSRVMGLTRGQWLSALMIAVGAIALPICIGRVKRLNLELLGGWAKKL